MKREEQPMKKGPSRRSRSNEQIIEQPKVIVRVYKTDR